MNLADHRLEAILEIARILVTGQDIDPMLSQLLGALINTIQAAEMGVIMIYDPTTQCLQVRGASGYKPAIYHIQLEVGEAMGGMAFQSGQPELYMTTGNVELARSNLRPPNRRLWQQATEGLAAPTSAVCIPLIAGQSRIGALILENRSKPGRFMPVDMPFLQTVADLTALAIENMALKKEVQETRALEEANRLKSELISTLAHEMRTPLTSIKGFSTALTMEQVNLPADQQREFLNIIDQECDILQNLIHDLLESSVIDAGLLKLEMQPVLLPRLAHEVIQDFQHRSARHHFACMFAPNFPIIDADPHRIEQVLRNLMDNAVKYSPQGGLIVMRGEVQPGQVLVSVADQGGGIAAQDLHRLFDKFFRAQSGLARHVIGAGLGLPIARTIIERHGGRIWAESQVGQGSTFYFTIPFQVDQSDE